MPYFMIVLIPHIDLLNLSWIIKYLFLRNMEPLMFLKLYISAVASKDYKDCRCFLWG